MNSPRNKYHSARSCKIASAALTFVLFSFVLPSFGGKQIITEHALTAKTGAAEGNTPDTRRCKTMKWFLDNVYGHAPVERPADMTFEGNTIVFGGGKVKINLTVAIPDGASADTPCPVLLMGDFRTWNNGMRNDRRSLGYKRQQDDLDALATARGYAIIHYDMNEAAPDQPRRQQLDAMRKAGKPLPPFAYGVFDVYGGESNRTDTSWGTIRAWAWCHSRVMDWIETQPALDAKRVAVLGHSRLGKTALCAGATDPRFRVVYSNASGCGGAKLNKMNLPRSEHIAQITKGFPYWFCRNFNKFRNRDMSVEHDQDEWMGLIASPSRYLYVASGSKDNWAGPAGEKAATESAAKAWEALGLKGMGGHVDYHCHEGPHDLGTYDLMQFLDFCDRRIGTKTKSDDKTDSRLCARVVFEQMPRPMLYGDPAHLRDGKPFAKDMTVIRHDGRYLMYYSVCGYPRSSCPKDWPWWAWGTAVATSTNLVDWTRIGDLRIQRPDGKSEYAGVAPCVKKLGGKIHIFHQKRFRGQDVLWHATSDDGLTFRASSTKPAFVPDNAWSIRRAIDAEVYRLGDRLMLMYATRERPTDRIQRLGMAWAPWESSYDAGTWTELSKNAPFFQPVDTWEMHCIEAPTVIYRKGIWYMFYAGAYNHETQQIGLAWSSDGINFKRFSDKPVFPNGKPGTWNAAESGHPGIFEDDDGQVYLFFQGKATNKGNYMLSCVKVRFEDRH